MENVPCEIFANKTKIETNLMNKENLNLQTKKLLL